MFGDNDGQLMPQCTHKLVPRPTEFRQISEDVDDLEAMWVPEAVETERKITTVMIKNIPNRYTQPILLAEIDSLGFADTYDFCHMPIDMINACNVGYAFINFVKPEICDAFVEVMQYYRFRTFRSRKLGACVPAHIQGIENNLKHFAKTRVMGWEKFRPFVRVQHAPSEYGLVSTPHHPSSPEDQQYEPSGEVEALADILRRCLNLCNRA
jgi:hypothetical protein